MTTATVTSVSYDVTDSDTENMHDNSVNNERITIRNSGRYMVIYITEYAPNNVGVRLRVVRLNGSGILADRRTAKNESNANLLGIFDLVEGDYIDSLAYQNSAGNLSLVASGTYAVTRLQVQRLY